MTKESCSELSVTLWLEVALAASKIGDIIRRASRWTLHMWAGRGQVYLVRHEITQLFHIRFILDI